MDNLKMKPKNVVSNGIAYKRNKNGTYYTAIGIKQKVKDVVIEQYCEGIPVKKIGHEAFYKCDYIESVTIPEGVEEIEYLAFSRCSKLKNVNISSTIIDIDE